MQSWVSSPNRSLIVLMIKIPLLRSGIFCVLINSSLVKTPNEGAVLFFHWFILLF